MCGFQASHWSSVKREQTLQICDRSRGPGGHAIDAADPKDLVSVGSCLEAAALSGGLLSPSFVSPTLPRSGVWCLSPPAGFLLTPL